jgi:hypothetical protein
MGGKLRRLEARFHFQPAAQSLLGQGAAYFASRCAASISRRRIALMRDW